MKTIVFGFDALDFRYLDLFDGSVPNISRLRDQGTEASLRSTHPPWTGSAWPSMYTGADPSHHGVYGFFTYDGYPDEGTHVSRSNVQQPALWNYLSKEGDRSIVMNVPVTHPAESLEGVLIPGYLATEDAVGYPEGVRDDVSDAIGEEYTIYSSAEMSTDLDAKFDGYLELIDQRRRAAVALLERHEWDLAILQVQKTDAVFHHFDEEHRFQAVYEAADRVVGDVLESLDEPVNVILCSDHGIGPVSGYQIHINDILRSNGFVETINDGGRSTPSVDKGALAETDRAGATDEDGDGGEGDAAPSGLEKPLLFGRRLASRLGVEPVDVYAAAERVGLGSTLVDLAPDTLKATAVQESVDWRRSKAYCAKGSRMGIRVNLAGREPNGVVPSSDYEAVRDELISLLSSLETPDGEPAFEFVCRREALYDGPYLERAPDVCFLPTDMNHTVSHALYGREFLPVEKHDHKPNGVFVGAGPGFSGDQSISQSQLSLTDIAPITMGLLGHSVPERMTGTVPDGLLAEQHDRADYGTVSYDTDRSEPRVNDEKVTERLEDLGYL